MATHVTCTACGSNNTRQSRRHQYPTFSDGTGARFELRECHDCGSVYVGRLPERATAAPPEGK